MCALAVLFVPSVVLSARHAGELAVVLTTAAVALALAVWLALVLTRRNARPIQELAEAAGRLGAGDPRPLGRRYGVTDLDQVADGLDSSARRLSSLLAANR